MWKSLVGPLRSLTQWHVNSQVTSRRNALVASTQLAQRRHQREDVEEFFIHRQARHEAPPQTDSGEICAAGTTTVPVFVAEKMSR